MMPISCILAGAMEQILKFLPFVVAGVVAVAVVIAFFVGVSKGFRRVSWKGLVWLAAGAGYFLIMKYEVGKTVLDKLGAFAPIGCALACVLAALVLYGVFSLLFRPRLVQVAKEGDRYTRGENGIEYDDEGDDYDDYADYQSDEITMRKGYRKPTVLGRFFGGIFCMLNAATIAIAVVSMLLLIVDCTKLKELMPALYEIKLGEINVMSFAMGYVSTYALDFVFMGIVIAVALAGRQKGLLESLRFILVKVLGTVAVLACFYLPFSKFAAADGGVYLLIKILERCTAFITSIGLSGTIAAIVAKLVAGLLTCAFVVILLVVLNWLMKKLIWFVEGVGFLRTVDGALACVAYVLVGALVAISVWAVLYVLNYYGIFLASEMFTDGATLTESLFVLFEQYLAPILDKITGAIQGVLAKFGL